MLELCNRCNNVNLDETRVKSPAEELETGLSRKGTDASVPWILQTDDNGWPILPLELHLPLPQLKEILRSFFTITYRKVFPHYVLQTLNLSYRQFHP
jgi:hypothetical protein